MFQHATPALQALYRGDRGAAEDLLPPDDQMSVHEAAAFGRVEVLRRLVGDEPARAQEVSPDGFTPLHLACFSGGAEAAAVLVEQGADLEALSQNEQVRVRPLGTAAFSGDRESARVLLDAGADPNARGDGGFTPLHSAAQNGDAELVRLLLDRGADPSSTLPDGRSAADLAREQGREDVVALLR